MNLTTAIAYLQAEHDNNTALNSTEKAILQNCISVINETSTVYTKAHAVDLLNDMYWDAPVNDFNEFGQGVFCVAYTVDPNRPFPTVRV